MPTESHIDWNARIAAIVAPPSRCCMCEGQSDSEKEGPISGTLCPTCRATYNERTVDDHQTHAA